MNANKKRPFLTKYGKETIVTFLSVFLLTMFLVYTSYSLFTDVDVAPSVNVVTVGTLEIEYDDTSTGLGGYITLNNANPISDATGIELTPYKFKITNTGNINAFATISIQDDTGAVTTCGCGSNLLSHDYIKVYLVRESDGFVIGPKALSSFEYIDRIELGENDNETYQVRVWVDENILGSEYLNKHFHGKIVVDTIQTTAVYDYGHTGTYQEFTAPYTGNYKIEAWGAQGGSNGQYLGGQGGYTNGEIQLTQGDKLYVYVGGQGGEIAASSNSGGYNGGGFSGVNSAGGGGATDIRFFGSSVPTNTVLTNELSASGLNSRIMVAAGGGGVAYDSTTSAGAGGGLAGNRGTSSATTYNTDEYWPKGGTQLAGGIGKWTTFDGSFGSSILTNNASWGGGGGSGYYGGAKGYGNTGAGGSSYISGHTGCIAIDITTDDDNEPRTARTGTSGATCTLETTDNLCSVHYSEKVFTDTIMIDGAGYSWTNVVGGLVPMPNPAGGTYASGTGRVGNGYARITFLGV